jgi:predicted nucleic-acid-binding protein
MIGVDTNVLARYYIDDATDAEAARQREAAQRLIECGNPLLVSKTVLLELEWVMRGYYDFEPAEVSRVLTHLLSLEHVEIEDREAVRQAVESHAAGLDFADGLHHASYSRCDGMATFDDRRFARRARRLGLLPPVMLCH